MKKRIIALLLSLVMLTSLLTPTALATEGQEPETTQEETVPPDQGGETENGGVKDEDQDEQTPADQPTTEDEEQSQDETKNEDEQPGEETGDPDQPSEEPGETETPDEPEQKDETQETEQTECTCGAAEGEEHAENCPLYEAAEEPEEEETPAEPIYYPEVSVGPIIDYSSNLTPVRHAAKKTLAAGARGAAASMDDSNTSGLSLSKDVSYKDGKYWITMEAFATGAEVTTSVSKPVDIVLMLDLSQYMTEDPSYNAVTNTYSNLQSAVQDGDYYCKVSGKGYVKVTSLSLSQSDGTCAATTAEGDQQVVACMRGTDDVYYCVLYQKDSNTGNAGKMDALRTAVCSFIDRVNANAPRSRIAIVTYGNDAQVETSSKKAADPTLSITPNATNDALVTVQGNVDYLKGIVEALEPLTGQDSNSHYASADAVKIFQDVTAQSGDSKGNSNDPEGLKDVYYERNRVALLFSAGVPGNGWQERLVDNRNNELCSFKRTAVSGQSVAQATMTHAVILKAEKGTSLTAPGGNMDGGYSWTTFTSEGYFKDTQFVGCGATVYCVGLDIPISGDPADHYIGSGKWLAGALANEYFYRVSTHRPTGVHYTSTDNLKIAFGDQGPIIYEARKSGTDYYSLYFFYPDILTRNQTKGYYLTTDSTSADNLKRLEDIFTQIADQTETTNSTKLTKDAVVRDVMSQYFTLPEGANKNDITLETWSYGETWTEDEHPSADIKASVDDNEVSVTGFDFAKNWCGQVDNKGDITYHGKKLVIKFQVEPKDGFLGGNNVPTNDEDYSGVYENENAEKPVGNFKSPVADVTIPEVIVIATDKNVYYGTALRGDELKEGMTATCGGVDIRDSSALGWQDDFVTIEITTPSGVDGTQDAEFSISATVKPTKDGTIDKDGVTGTGKAKVNVYTPEITWKDSAIELGEEANYEDTTAANCNFVSAVWKHKDAAGTETRDTDVTMTGGKKPTSLNYTYNPQEGKFQEDTSVKVTNVTATFTDNTDNTDKSTVEIPVDKVKFVHVKCDVVGCKWDQDGFKDCQFIVHIKPFDLTITKSGWDTIDENQAFVFRVQGSDVDMYVTINFKAGDENTKSVTIKDLKPGTYTITEESGWSWRYNPTPTKQKITPKDVGTTKVGQAYVSFENSRTKNIYWLNGCSWAVNNWASGKKKTDKAPDGETN